MSGLSEYMTENAERLLSAAPPFPVSGTPDGLGNAAGAGVVKQVEKVVPLVRDVRRLRRSANGLGQEGEVTAGTVTLVVLGMALRAGAGYFVGRAMAPRPSSRTAYAWTGAAVSMVFGALGLGVQGFIALRSGGAQYE